MSNLQDQFELARRWLSDTDSVLLASGAGLSAAAGIDYGDKKWFAKNFSPMLQYGISTCAEILGGMGLPPLLQWGYLSHQLELVRFGEIDHPVYRLQFETLRDRDYFIFTSNVDALYGRHGFDSNRVYTPQGDYARMQCVKPCIEKTWSTRSFLERIRERTDPNTWQLQDESCLPQCPNCGGPMFMNVRAAHWFLETPYLPQRERLISWLDSVSGRKLLVIEIGAGFNTPSVIRWPAEQIATQHADAKLIRVNPEHAERGAGFASRPFVIDGMWRRGIRRGRLRGMTFSTRNFVLP
jgi:NAD-dependent SIR2 family protein deacetylase